MQTHNSVLPGDKFLLLLLLASLLVGPIDHVDASKKAKFEINPFFGFTRYKVARYNPPVLTAAPGPVGYAAVGAPPAAYAAAPPAYDVPTPAYNAAPAYDVPTPTYNAAPAYDAPVSAYGR